MDENSIILKTIDHEIAMCQTWSTYWQAMAVTRVATNRKLYHGVNGPEFTDQEKIEDALNTALTHLHRMRELIDKKKRLLSKSNKTINSIKPSISIDLDEIVDAVKTDDKNKRDGYVILDDLDELIDLDNPIELNKTVDENSSKNIDKEFIDAFDIDSNMDNLEKELRELELEDDADIVEVEDKLYIIDRKEK